VDESKLKSALLKQIKIDLPGFVALRHEDVRTAGIPDLSLTGYGRTTWWEFKYADPNFQSTGIQELTMLRLAATGFARYVIWEERNGIKRTMIIHPKNIGVKRLEIQEAMCIGFNHAFLTTFVRQVHTP
jgi:hypothetical protein